MKTIIEMACEAGITLEDKKTGEYSAFDQELERFAELIRANEREACAKLLENIVQDYDWAHRELGLELAGEIRGRKEKCLQSLFVI